LLCVQTDNSGTKGIFFDTGTTHTALYPSAADAFKSAPDCVTDYNYICYEKDSLTGRSSDDNYVYGDYLPTIHIPDVANPTTAVTAFGGSLPLTSADSHGFCSEVRREETRRNETSRAEPSSPPYNHHTNNLLLSSTSQLNSAEFGETVDKEDNSCVREVTDLASQCEVDLDFEKFTTDLFVSRKQSTAYAQAPTLTDFLNVGIIKVDYAGTYDASQGSDWDTGTSTCKQALKSICYEVRYDANFEIVEIGARLELVDVTATGFFEQSYSIEFIGISPPANGYSLASNNFVNRTRSGNPGYIFERPVLGGRIHPDESKAIMAASKGFQIMSAPTGECDVSDPINSNKGQTVGFGVDTSSTCTISLMVDELKQLCEGTAHGGNDYLFKYKEGQDNPYIPAWITTMYNTTYSEALSGGLRSNSGLLLGIFGNADPLDETQWIDVVSLDLPTTAPSYLEAQQTCTGFPTSTHYKIQWTNVGSTTNPQAKIMSAQVEHGTEPMVFMNTLAAGAAETQKFPFTVTVEWQYYELDSELYSPPAPPIIFSVPYDVFYPFQIDSAAVRRGGGGSLLILCITGGVAIIASMFLI
jgi:hypothetical protein